MAPQLDPRLASPRARRYRIVVGIDLSEYSDIVIEHALDQAARHDTPELHLLTVNERRKPSSDGRGLPPAVSAAEWRRGSNDVLKQALWERVYPALETFNAYGTDWRARLHVRRGKPEVEIAELAAELRADLIVIGQFGLHSGGSSDKNLPNRVLQQAVCPTLVVGLPIDAETSPQCPLCVVIRDDTEGARWFCQDHDGDHRADHFVSPMTSWSGGSLLV